MTRTRYDSDGEEEWVYAYTYDEAGNKIQWLRYEDGKLDSKELYTRDEYGNLLETLSYYGEDDDEPSKQTFKYIYDESRKVKETTAYRGFQEGTTKKYTYHENGAVSRDERWLDGELFMFWECNEDGRPVVGERYTTRKSEKLVLRWEYTYDSNGNLAEQKIYENGELTEHYRYTYTQIRILPEKVDMVIDRQRVLMEDFY